MKTSFVLGALTVAGLAAGAAVAGTLDDAKARGTRTACSNRSWALRLQTPAESGKALTLECAALSQLQFLEMQAQ